MEITMDRRAEIPGAKDVKYQVTVRSLDGHTHGELTRADQAAIRFELVKCADKIETILKKQAQICEVLTVEEA